MTITLDNGASCIAFEPTSWEYSHDNHASEGVALALCPDGEYVTWIVSHRPSGAWDAFSGHYFGSDVTAAALDFGQRSGLAKVL